MSTARGQGLMDRGFCVSGRDTRDEFRNLPFLDQQLVVNDSQNYSGTPESEVVANFFGAYLFLNALSLLPVYVRRVILLLPIIGTFEDEENALTFEPPYPERLKQLLGEGKIHVQWT